MGVNTRTISTFNGATQAAGQATSLILDTLNRRLRINKLEGYCVGNNGDSTTQYFLQIFASATVPANNAVPLRSLQVLANDGFVFDYAANDPLNVSQLSEPPNTGNCVVVLSTTEHTLTIATGNIKMDLTAEIEDYETQPINTTTVGDTVTAVTSLQVWAEAASPTPSALIKVIATNNAAGTQYLMLFAKDAPQAGDVPITPAWTFTAGQTRVLNFGDANAGVLPQSADTIAENAAQTVRRGCSLFTSTTAGFYTSPGANGWTIEAIYRSQP